MKLHKKIDTFYRDNKGNIHYLHSTRWHKTCKSATESTKNKDLEPYEGRIGESLNKEGIFSRFDHEHRD